MIVSSGQDVFPGRREKYLGKGIVYYEDSILGKGQFGTVYKGYCRTKKCEVAVKIFSDRIALPAVRKSSYSSLSTEASSEAAAGREEERLAPPLEISVLAQLKARNCPNILRLHSSWSEKKLSTSSNRTYVIVSEYCPGGDLCHWMQVHGKVSETAARSLLYQLCNALLVLKSERIIHRDIKPSNLLLTSKVLEEAVLKVADLGMAKGATVSPVCDTGAESDARMTCSILFHSTMGTPMYMSPERIRQNPYSYNADVYSAGMVLYELIVGRPVRATSPAQLLTAVPDAIQYEASRYQSGEGVPLWLDLLQGMVVQDPQKRFSVEEVLRHSWFEAKNGPPLPPLTVSLPLSQPLPQSTPLPVVVPSFPHQRVQQSSSPSTHSSSESSMESWPMRKVAQRPIDEEGSRAPLWTVLSTSRSASLPEGTGSTLPASCGPYITTFAARNFIWCVLLYVVEEETEVANILIVLSFLMELLQTSHTAFLQNTEQLRRTLPVKHIAVLNEVWHGLFARVNMLVAQHWERLGSHQWQRLYPKAEAIILRKALSYIERDAFAEAAGTAESHASDLGTSTNSLSQRPRSPEGENLNPQTYIHHQAHEFLSGYQKALALLRVLLRHAVLTYDEATGQLYTTSIPDDNNGDTNMHPSQHKVNTCVNTADTVSTRYPQDFLIHLPLWLPLEEKRCLSMTYTILERLTSHMMGTQTR